MNFNQFALSIFEKYVKGNNRYLAIRKKLRSAHIFKPYEEYISVAILVSLMAGILGLILGLLIGYFITTRFTISIVMNPAAADIFNIFTPYKSILTILIFTSLSTIIFFGITYSIFMIYPTLQCSVRKVKIDTMLPYTLMYMYSLSKGETNLVEIIKSVANLPNIYGEISNEFAMVLRDMELLGIDFMSALRNVQKDTPSENLRQFLGSLITIIDNGGDITDFFSIQIEGYRIKKKSEHTLFLDMLGMIAEGYVTGFVAGPLFLIITGVTLGAMQGSMTGLLLGLTYVVLPFGSIGFIFVVDIMLPKDEQKVGILKLKKVKEFIGIRVISEEEKEKKLFQEYEKSMERIKIENIIKNPLKSFYEEPALSLYVSVPIAALIILIPFISNFSLIFEGYVPFSQMITNYIFFAVLVGLIPYIIFFEIKHKKLWKVESSIPQFLKNLSIINETGLSLVESLRVMLRTEKGELRFYIENIYTDMMWGASTVDAFTRFANKLRLSSLSRVVALITKASQTSGDIRQVLDIAATDSNMNIQLRKDKSTNMLIYIIIIYITFLVFLYIIYNLTTTLLPQMDKVSQVSGSTFISGGFSLDFNKIYFYHTALIQGFFSGIMTGVLGEGDYRLGFKHSIIMITIAFILFQLFVF